MTDVDKALDAVYPGAKLRVKKMTKKAKKKEGLI